KLRSISLKSLYEVTLPPLPQQSQVLDCHHPPVTDKDHPPQPTCVKIIEVANSSNEVVDSAVVIMPHLRDCDTWGYSSFAEVSLLKEGVTYKISVKDFYNMSYLASNAKYRDKGGVDGP